MGVHRSGPGAGVGGRGVGRGHGEQLGPEKAKEAACASVPNTTQDLRTLKVKAKTPNPLQPMRALQPEFRSQPQLLLWLLSLPPPIHPYPKGNSKVLPSALGCWGPGRYKPLNLTSPSPSIFLSAPFKTGITGAVGEVRSQV